MPDLVCNMVKVGTYNAALSTSLVTLCSIIGLHFFGEFTPGPLHRRTIQIKTHEGVRWIKKERYQIQAETPLKTLRPLSDNTSNNVELINPSQPTVIIWTQIRSGSTFTASLLSHLPLTFYSAEPMRRWANDSLGKEEDPALLAKQSEFFKNLLRCKIQNETNYLRNENEVEPDDSLIEYCFPSSGRDGRMGDLCQTGNFLAFQCKRARIHLIKIVTYRLRNVLQYLSHPEANIKIIHLVRDPRGMLRSTRKIVGKDHLFAKPEFFCGPMREDLAAADEIRRKFPKKYFLLHYEQLALAPVAIMEKVLKFINIPFTASFLQIIRSHTFVFEAESNNEIFGARKYSRNRALQWRETLTFSEVQEIQNNCSDILNQLKLHVFDTEEKYKNLSVPVLMQMMT